VLLRLENDLRAYTAETLWMQGCYNLFYLLPGFFTSNVFVLAVAAILSFGVVAIAFGYKYRAAVFAPLPGAQLGGIARQTVPYGVALAPAQILFSLSSGICLSFVGNASGENAQGLFAFGYSLAQLVTAIQAGFSTYWGPYVYSHYRDEQERICRVHDVLNLLIFGFFCVLVMFEDIVFVIFPDKRGCLAIFPLLMLAVVFNILCEGTVYGNSIARKPWHDTIGIGLGALSNFGLCALLVPAFGLTGAALALAASNGLAFLYRSVTGQMYYRTVASYPKTISGFLLAFAVTAIGTLLWQHFFIKFALVGVILFIYCTLYRAQLARLWSMGLGILRGIFHRK
jgi:O-antigen/teichoic acid export membrane protein